jgi:hypothetical protein
MSVAGSLADWVLKLVLFVPICVIEFVAFFLDGSVRLEERWSAVILLPLEIVGLVTSGAVQNGCGGQVDHEGYGEEPPGEGRLRLAYDDSRDATECIGAEDDKSVTLRKEWVDNGGGGRNPGKYAQINPEGPAGWLIPQRMPMERQSWVIKSISGPRQWGAWLKPTSSRTPTRPRAKVSPTRSARVRATTRNR